MLLLDDKNYIRGYLAGSETIGFNPFFDKFLAGSMPWLENNFFIDLLNSFGLTGYARELAQGAWLLFLTIFSVVIVYVIASLFSKKFAEKLAQKQAEKDQFAAKVLYTVLYYTVITLLIAAVIFVLVMVGVYAPLYTPNPNEGYYPPPVSDSIIKLLYLFLLCAIFVLIIPVVAFVFALLFHLVSKFVGWFVALINQYRRTVDEKEAVEVEDGFGLGGAGGMGGGDINGVVDIEDSVNVDIDEPIKIQEEPAPPQVLGKEIFPSLVRLDEQYTERETVSENAEMSLEEFCLQFQAYAITRKIYYELPMLRSFLAGLASARLIILEGLSGTGKSMLPRMFCEFTNSKSFFAPVQATWRDKSDMLGYFSEFTKSFKSTDFLKNLYEASYTDRVNLMVLDEMNISRIEYYFADFLSILEYPPEDWKVRVFEPVLGQELPNKLPDGYVSIPENTWFIGTANTDDSTFTITDKVYDRAVVLDFAEKFSPITSNYTSDPIRIDYMTLKKMFVAAQNDSSKRLSATDEEKFAKVCDYVAEAFDLRFGNRIMVQINNFVPVYVALGGTKEEALDFMFARKILRKLNGAFEDDVKDKLIALLKLLNATYGKGTFKQTEKAINKLLKRLV